MRKTEVKPIPDVNVGILYQLARNRGALINQPSYPLIPFQMLGFDLPNNSIDHIFNERDGSMIVFDYDKEKSGLLLARYTPESSYGSEAIVYAHRSDETNDGKTVTTLKHGFAVFPENGYDGMVGQLRRSQCNLGDRLNAHQLADLTSRPGLDDSLLDVAVDLGLESVGYVKALLGHSKAIKQLGTLSQPEIYDGGMQ